MRLLKQKYNDEALIQAAERAMGDVPTVDLSKLNISSDHGVVTLSGQVKNSLARRHAVDAIRQAFQHAGLKHERIVDETVER